MTMNFLLFLLSALSALSSSVSEDQEFLPYFVNDNKITREDALGALSAYQYNWYMNFAQMEDRITLLQEQFPDKITVKIAGRSRENRPIYLIIVTDKMSSTKDIASDNSTIGSDIASDNSTIGSVLDPTRLRAGKRKLRMEESDNTTNDIVKPVIFIDGGIHAREWVAPAAAFYVIDKLLQSPYLTSNLEWRVIPLVNPDGYEYSRTRSRLWRKNRARTYSSRCKGVDLNRNFPVHFGRTSRNACSETYGGPAAFSEPETRAIRDALVEVTGRTQAYVTLHTYGQLILYPYGYTKRSKPPTVAKLIQMGNGMSGAIYTKYKNSYRVRQASVLGAAAGGSDDWAFIHMRVPYSYTFELQDRVNIRYEFTTRGFVLSTSKLPQAVDECWLGLEFMGKKIISEQGLGTRVKPISPIHASPLVSETHIIPQIHEADSDEEDQSNEKVYPVGWEQVIKEVQRIRTEVDEDSHRNMRDDCVHRGNMYICPHMVFWGSMYNNNYST